VQPAPAPRYSRTPASIAGPAPAPGQHTAEALQAWGFSSDEVAKLQEAGAISQTEA
jgi:alpha-methylacyl-CoA racemase